MGHTPIPWGLRPLAHTWAESLRNPCVVGGPEKRGQNQKSLRQIRGCSGFCWRGGEGRRSHIPGSVYQKWPIKSLPFTKFNFPREEFGVRPGGLGWGGWHDASSALLSEVGSAYWPRATSPCPFLEPPPSAGGGAHQPLTPECLCSPGLAHPDSPLCQRSPRKRPGGGVWHKASVSDCLPLAAPIGLSRGGGGVDPPPELFPIQASGGALGWPLPQTEGGRGSAPVRPLSTFGAGGECARSGSGAGFCGGRPPFPRNGRAGDRCWSPNEAGAGGGASAVERGLPKGLGRPWGASKGLWSSSAACGGGGRSGGRSIRGASGGEGREERGSARSSARDEGTRTQIRALSKKDCGSQPNSLRKGPTP